MKTIEGFPLYAVDENGDVWSLRHGGKRKLKPMLTGAKRKQYRAVGLCRDGVQTNRKVAHLVLEAFVGPRPFPTAQCRHLNDDSLDDRLENLAWGTASDNSCDMRRNNNGGAQCLTIEQVVEIKRRLADGEYCRRIAGDYGVSRWAIHDIKQGRTWRDAK